MLMILLQHFVYNITFYFKSFENQFECLCAFNDIEQLNYTSKTFKLKGFLSPSMAGYAVIKKLEFDHIYPTERNYLSYVGSPSCRHATRASTSLNPSSHTVPHELLPWILTSKRPFVLSVPSRNRMILDVLTTSKMMSKILNISILVIRFFVCIPLRTRMILAIYFQQEVFCNKKNLPTTNDPCVIRMAARWWREWTFQKVFFGSTTINVINMYWSNAFSKSCILHSNSISVKVLSTYANDLHSPHHYSKMF